MPSNQFPDASTIPGIMQRTAAGFRLYDISDATMPRLLDEFDTDPTVAGPSFDGAWGVYPFIPSGHIYVSDRTGGLFIFALEQ